MEGGEHKTNAVQRCYSFAHPAKMLHSY